MAKKAKQAEIPIYLDVDWLLGDQPEPRHRPFRKRSAFPNMVGAAIGSCAVLFVLYSWPHLSTFWLQSQWSRQLTTAETDESLGLIMALSELGNHGAPSVLLQLNDDDPEKRAVAFRALAENIEAMQSKKDGASQLLTLANELKTNTPTNTATKLMHVQLATKILDSTPRSSTEYSNIEAMCASIVDSVNADQVVLTQAIVPKVQKPSEILPNISSRNPVSAPQVGARLTDWTTDTIPLPSLPAPIHATSSTSTEPALTIPAKTKPVSARMSDVASEAPTAPHEPSIPHSSVRLASKAIVTDSDAEAATALQEISGLNKIPLEQLFPMLGSTQNRRVETVFDELVRRGVSEPVIDRAIDLARGNSQQRLVALDEIVRSDAMNPLPLLVWMAQTNDRPVRQRAIAILGSMQDPEAMRRLRELVHREPDEYLQQQIRQALVAGGYANR